MISEESSDSSGIEEQQQLENNWKQRNNNHKSKGKKRRKRGGKAASNMEGSVMRKEIRDRMRAKRAALTPEQQAEITRKSAIQRQQAREKQGMEERAKEKEVDAQRHRRVHAQESDEMNIKNKDKNMMLNIKEKHFWSGVPDFVKESEFEPDATQQMFYAMTRSVKSDGKICTEKDEEELLKEIELEECVEAIEHQQHDLSHYQPQVFYSLFLYINTKHYQYHH